MEERKDEMSVKRRFYSTEKIDEMYRRVKIPKKSVFEEIKTNCFCSKKRVWTLLTTVVPSVKIISRYKVENILADLIGGLTVAILHVPQSISLAIMAGLKPEHGLYTSLFPTILYLLFGTSPHISFGTNAILAIYTRYIIEREVGFYTIDTHQTNVTSSTFTSSDVFQNYSLPHMSTESLSNMLTRQTTGPAIESGSQETTMNTGTIPAISRTVLDTDLMQVKVEVAMTASFFTGIFMLGLGIFRLGWLSKYMSNSFIGGFTTAMAIHTASLEVPKMLGIIVPNHFGAARLIKLYIDVLTKIRTTTIADLMIALITLSVLITARIIKDKYDHRLKFPMPFEIALLLIGVIASYFGKLESSYNATVLGDVPSGIPQPTIPPFNRASRIATDSIVIAILSFTMSISLAKTKTDKEVQKHVDSNQELLAYGISNIVSSFFHCFPQATSPPRTMVQMSSHVKTTFNAIPVGVVLTLVVLWIVRVFSPLPVSMVSTVIIVSLKDLLVQFVDMPKYWKINKFDFLTWVMTFLVSVFADLEYGLLTGIAISFITVVVQDQYAKGRLIGFSDQEDIFIDARSRIHVREFPSIKVFLFEASIHFANADIFREQLFKLVINPKTIIKNGKRTQTNNSVATDDNHVRNASTECHVTGNQDGDKAVHDTVKHVVFDCKMISYIDISGVNILKEVLQEYKAVGINVYFACCSRKMKGTLLAAGFFDTFPKELLFHDVFDAIYFINGSAFVTTDSVAIVQEITKL